MKRVLSASDCLTAVLQSLGRGFAEGYLKIYTEFDQNTNENPSSRRNIPKLIGTAQLPAGTTKPHTVNPRP